MIGELALLFGLLVAYVVVVASIAFTVRTLLDRRRAKPTSAPEPSASSAARRGVGA